MGNRHARAKTINPSNLDDLFTAEIPLSLHFSDQVVASIFSPFHKSAILNQFQQQQQSMLSPINTNVFSPKSGDQHMPSHLLLQASFGLPSPGRMSPQSVEAHSPMSSRLAALAQQQEKQQQQLRSLSSLDLGSCASAAVTPRPLTFY